MKKQELEAFAREVAKGLKTEEDLNEFSQMLTKVTVEAALNAELDDHLGYARHEPSENANSRNGYGSKTLTTGEGQFELETPRDRQGSFEPKLVKKGQRRFTSMDDQILSLYAKGMTTREIVATFKEMYDAEISPTLISRVTDAVLERVVEWQSRPLEAVYPIVYLDCIVVKIRQDKRVINKAIYLAGRPVKSAQRLQRVTLRSAPGQGGLMTLYNYRLRYRDVSTGAIDSLSRLVSVQGCVGAGETACQPKTEFAWSDPKAGFNDKADITTTLKDSNWGIVDTTPADINGDGLTDLVWTEARGKQHRIRYALTSPDTGQLVNQDFITTRDEKDVLVYDVTYGCKVCDDQLKVHVNPVDINADGRQDLLVYSTVDNKTWLHLATPRAGQTQASDAIVWQLDGAGTFLFDGRYRYADLNSDGLLDAYRLDELAPIRTGLKAVSGYRLLVRYLVVDTNAAASSNRYYTYSAARAHPIDFVTQAANTTNRLRWRALSMADTALADVDGDGRADLVLWGIDSEETFPDQGGSVVLSSLERLTVFRQSGAGSATRFVPYGPAVDVSPASPAAPRAVRVRDLNQDGLSDLIYFTGKRYNRNVLNPRWTGDWHYRLSTGAGYTSATVLLDTPANARAPRAPFLHDDNGDGYPDFLWHDRKAKQLKRKRYEPETGTFAAAAKVRATKGEDEERYLTVDMNGDGHGDLLYFYHKGTSIN